MKVRFWGVRGSIPTPGPTTVKYGGNTTCLEVRGDEDELLVIDAGTGLRELGNFLIANDFKKHGKLKITILLSHTHWDHIHGFPFFAPAYIPSSEINILGPVNFSGSLQDIVAGQMSYSYFPIKMDELKAKITFKEIQESKFSVGNFEIQSKYLNHPILDLGYRITHKGKTFVTCYDTEPYRNLFESDTDSDEEVDREAMAEAERYVEEMNDKIIRHMDNADLCIYDAQYRAEEYEMRKGWGHSTIEHAIESGARAKVQRLALFHHDPLRTDDQLDEIFKYSQNKARELSPDWPMKVFIARERLEVTL